MQFKTHGVLTATTGILMGGMDGIYAVASYLLDRPAFTHELAHYAAPMKAALLACRKKPPAKTGWRCGIKPSADSATRWN